jgi:hypothetical protein
LGPAASLELAMRRSHARPLPIRKGLFGGGGINRPIKV